MKKRIMAALMTAILAITCVTAVSAAQCTMVYNNTRCTGTLISLDCAFNSLDECDITWDYCEEHDRCRIYTYYAPSISQCNKCDVYDWYEATHAHAVGHSTSGVGNEYMMDTICPWF